MSDDFLSRLREEPRPEFEDRLEGRLHEIDARERERRLAPSPYRRFVPALAGASLVAALALAFTPRARAGRGARVPRPLPGEALRRGAGRPRAARAAREGRARLQEPRRRPGPGRGGAAGAGGRGEPRGGRGRGRHHRPAAERAAAAHGAGRDDAGPARHASACRSTPRKLEALALAAGADEIEIPAWWNGATIDVEVPPVLAMRYARTVDAGDGRPPREDSFVLLQSATPQVELPEGFDLATLGRLGLRVAGMSAEEALTLLPRDRLAGDAPRPGAGPGRDVPRGRGVRPAGACS